MSSLHPLTGLSPPWTLCLLSLPVSNSLFFQDIVEQRFRKSVCSYGVELRDRTAADHPITYAHWMPRCLAWWGVPGS